MILKNPLVHPDVPDFIHQSESVSGDIIKAAVKPMNLWIAENAARLHTVSENAAQACQAGVAEKIAEEAWHILQNNKSASKK